MFSWFGLVCFPSVPHPRHRYIGRGGSPSAVWTVLVFPGTSVPDFFRATWFTFSVSSIVRDGHLGINRGKWLTSTDMTSILSHSSSEGELNGGMSTYLGTRRGDPFRSSLMLTRAALRVACSLCACMGPALYRGFTL